MNRGSPGVRSKPLPIKSGFNEAPIHESGKSSSSGGDPSRRSRFNEAPIHESGKSGKDTNEDQQHCELQ